MTTAMRNTATHNTAILNTTYYRLELRRVLRDRVTLFFTLSLIHI